MRPYSRRSINTPEAHEARLLGEAADLAELTKLPRGSEMQTRHPLPEMGTARTIYGLDWPAGGEVGM
jgi:hypothetical protein